MERQTRCMLAYDLHVSSLCDFDRHISEDGAEKEERTYAVWHGLEQ